MSKKPQAALISYAKELERHPQEAMIDEICDASEHRVDAANFVGRYRL